MRMTDFHIVKIFDDELRAFVKHNIGKQDSVIIAGQINYDLLQQLMAKGHLVDTLSLKNCGNLPEIEWVRMNGKKIFSFLVSRIEM